MKIVLGADHGGYELKEKVRRYLAGKKHRVTDFGTFGRESCDYPPLAERVSRAVAGKKFRCGILVCTTGIGMSMAANKVRGIRAALCLCAEAARCARGHNDANVLVLSGKFTGEREMKRILDQWLHTRFFGGRHLRRVNQIMAIEKRRR